MTDTPKPNWSNTDFVSYIKRFLPVPIYWTTDVNGSVYGEWTAYQQKGQTFNSLIYYTIGTGIGAGIISDGKFISTLGPPWVIGIRMSTSNAIQST